MVTCEDDVVVVYDWLGALGVRVKNPPLLPTKNKNNFFPLNSLVCLLYPLPSCSLATSVQHTAAQEVQFLRLLKPDTDITEINEYTLVGKLQLPDNSFIYLLSIYLHTAHNVKNLRNTILQGVKNFTEGLPWILT